MEYLSTKKMSAQTFVCNIDQECGIELLCPATIQVCRHCNIGKFSEDKRSCKEVILIPEVSVEDFLNIISRLQTRSLNHTKYNEKLNNEQKKNNKC